MKLIRLTERLIPAALRGPRALVVGVVGLVALSGCSVGAYTVDYFQEMHYSPSVRRQEPPIMNVPADAVAYRGFGIPGSTLVASPPYDTMSAAELVAITENGLADNPRTRELGKALFDRNCAVCHGIEGNGNGAPLLVFNFPEGKRPADLTSSATTARSDGALFAAVTNGQGTVDPPEGAANPAAWATLTNMPRFEKLLTAEERWAIIWHVRGLQQP